MLLIINTKLAKKLKAKQNFAWNIRRLLSINGHQNLSYDDYLPALGNPIRWCRAGDAYGRCEDKGH